MKKISILIITLLFITGCACSRFVSKAVEYRKQEKEYINIAISEAKKYIRDKYGFDLIDNEIDETDTLTDGYYGSQIEITPPNGKVIIEAHHDGISYKIFVDASSRNSDKYYDNYEKNIILNDLYSYFKEKLGYDKSNLRIFTNDEMFFGIQSHDKYTNVNSFFSKINIEADSNLLVLTSEDIDKEVIEALVREMGIKILNIAKIDERDNIYKYNLNKKTLPYSILLDSDLFTNGSLFIEQEAMCHNGYCSFSEYNIVDLDNNNYIKFIGKDSNFERIEDKKYEDEIKNCNKGSVSSVYRIMNDRNTIYSYNLYVSNISKIIIIDGDNIKCNPFTVTKKEGNYSVFTNIIKASESNIIIVTN